MEVILGFTLILAAAAYGLVVNQHTCEVIDEGHKLRCTYSGVDGYFVDRKLDTIETIEFSFFGKGQIHAEENVDNLKDLLIKATDQEFEMVCLNIFVKPDVTVEVMGRKCVSVLISLVILFIQFLALRCYFGCFTTALL
jgi:hypothetical protein